jgi:Fe-S cluster biosynthesis and repair protein YggX
MCAQMNREDRLILLQNMVEADPDNDLAHFSLGKLHFEGKELAEAESAFRRTLELNPQHSVAHLFLGKTLADSGRQDEAVAVLEKGISLAHEKGEFQPRNQMQDLLRLWGRSAPDPAREERAKRGGQEGEFACQRCGLPNPRLEEPPFENALGTQIQQSICVNCWREWIAMSIKVINEYRLNLSTEQGSQVFDHHMKEFLGLKEGA